MDVETTLCAHWDHRLCENIIKEQGNYFISKKIPTLLFAKLENFIKQLEI